MFKEHMEVGHEDGDAEEGEGEGEGGHADGVHGIIGGGSNIVTVALEQALMESDIVQVSYTSG
jgi:hypothetical protein